MPVEVFLDTNILLYAYDLGAFEKRAVALPILERAWRDLGTVAISVQVLQEFYVNFVRTGESDSTAMSLVHDLSDWPVVENTLDLLCKGISIKQRWQVSLWDSLIIAAAQASGARTLYTEDLNHGQVYGGVQVVNPFRS